MWVALCFSTSGELDKRELLGSHKDILKLTSVDFLTLFTFAIVNHQPRSQLTLPASSARRLTRLTRCWRSPAITFMGPQQIDLTGAYNSPFFEALVYLISSASMTLSHAPQSTVIESFLQRPSH